MKLTTTTTIMAVAAGFVIARSGVKENTSVQQYAHTQTSIAEPHGRRMEKNPFENLSKKELWQYYREYRKDGNTLKDSGLYDASVVLLLGAAECAGKLDRRDLASWQMNNAAKHLIDKFKERTGYGHRMNTIESMKRGEEKQRYIDKTRDVLLGYIENLETAHEYLQEAAVLNEQLPDERRNRVISSNSKFISWVKSFVYPES
ncbi:MAG: hypothetical protein GF401_11385 [Chitinivibrionales bacterium]|nr:hypothetical protein [Chitinivibrionales bacterium]